MNTATPPVRSAFVTVVAWVFIIFSGLGTLIGILQNVLVAFVFPMKEMQQVLHDPHGPPLPSVALFMLEHAQLMVATILLMMVLLLISSIGLLKRKNWARKLFIFFMAWGIVSSLLNPLIQHSLLSSSLFAPPGSTPGGSPGAADVTMMGMEIVTAVMALGFALLFGWIIKRLVSREVKEEFGVYEEKDEDD